MMTETSGCPVILLHQRANICAARRHTALKRVAYSRKSSGPRMNIDLAEMPVVRMKNHEAAPNATMYDSEVAIAPPMMPRVRTVKRVTSAQSNADAALKISGTVGLDMFCVKYVDKIGIALYMIIPGRRSRTTTPAEANCLPYTSVMSVGAKK